MKVIESLLTLVDCSLIQSYRALEIFKIMMWTRSYWLKITIYILNIYFTFKYFFNFYNLYTGNTCSAFNSIMYDICNFFYYDYNLGKYDNGIFIETKFALWHNGEDLVSLYLVSDLLSVFVWLQTIKYD
jgi:hypothetical protein